MIKVTKKAINLREKLNELKFDRVPFQKMPAGSVVQVVDDGQSSQLNVTAVGTWTDTGTSVTISPLSTSSTVLISVCMPFRIVGASGYMKASLRVLRDSTVIWNSNGYYETFQVRNANNEWNDVANILWRDSPSTTSSVTYKVQCRLTSGDIFRIYPTDYGTRMVLQEITG